MEETEKLRVGRPSKPGVNGFYITWQMLQNLGLTADSPKEKIRSRLLMATQLFSIANK